jgi:hypothetical protein
MFGLTGRWRADFRAFSRSNWDAQACFCGVLHHTAPYLRHQRQIVMSLDDTGLPKRSRMIKACSWLRDPLGPRGRAGKSMANGFPLRKHSGPTSPCWND